LHIDDRVVGVVCDKAAVFIVVSELSMNPLPQKFIWTGLDRCFSVAGL
jgi:hypothetical protein